MSVLHRIFKISPAPERDPDLDRLSAAADEKLQAQRQDFQQTLQKLESGTRVMRTMSGAMGMMRGLEGG